MGRMGDDLADLRGTRFENADLHRRSVHDGRPHGRHVPGRRAAPGRDAGRGDLAHHHRRRDRGRRQSTVSTSGPLIEAELDRLYPDRPLFRPTYRRRVPATRGTWNERLWACDGGARPTAAGRSSCTPRSPREWSFIETLRHLAFATESWVGPCLRSWATRPRGTRCRCRGTRCFPRAGVPAGPRRAAVARRGAHAPAGGDGARARRGRRPDPRVSSTPEAHLAGRPGLASDEGRLFTVRQCLQVVLNEEWEHRRYAERDLAVLEAQSSGAQNDQGSPSGPSAPYSRTP